MAVHHHKLPIVTDGLVFQVDAANNLCDNVTNVRNIVTPTEIGSFVNGASVVNDVYDFDGVDDRINCGLFMNNKGSQYTFSLWAKHDNINTIQMLFQKRGTINTDVGAALDPAGVIEFGGHSPTNRVVSTSFPVVGEWYNIVGTMDFTTEKKIYYNGILEGQNTSVTPYKNVLTEEFTLGARKNNVPATTFNYSMDGQIANLKVYTRILTAAEIQQNYEATKHKFE